MYPPSAADEERYRYVCPGCGAPGYGNMTCRYCVAQWPRFGISQQVVDRILEAIGGRTHSLRTVWHATIIEHDVLYRHFQNDRDVVELLQRKADAYARHGNAGMPHGTRSRVTLPGCEIFSTQE